MIEKFVADAFSVYKEDNADIDKLTARLDTLRTKFENHLHYEYYEKPIPISTVLFEVLNSGIALTAEQYTEIAKRHKDNLCECRLLHESAAAYGFNLDCYVAYDALLTAFDGYIGKLKSGDYKNIEDAEKDGKQIVRDVKKRSFECVANH